MTAHPSGAARRPPPRRVRALALAFACALTLSAPAAQALAATAETADAPEQTAESADAVHARVFRFTNLRGNASAVPPSTSR
jgi:hypothetical protein